MSNIPDTDSMGKRSSTVCRLQISSASPSSKQRRLDTIRIAEVVAGTLFKAVTDDGDGGQQEAFFTDSGLTTWFRPVLRLTFFFAVKLVLRAVSLLDSMFSKVILLTDIKEHQLDMYKSSLKRQNPLDGTASERKWKHIRLNANPLAGRVFESRVQPHKQAKAKAVSKPSSATNSTASSAAKVGSGTGNAAQKKKVSLASIDVDGKS
ncbi:hypothetical protein C8F01DRAFT_1080477 [Mycena amicta]|nr:hypothetical protein C8F01DRAFT_1080477 [Mycena amicta]